MLSTPLAENYVCREQRLVPIITVSGSIPVKNVHHMRYKPFLPFKSIHAPHVPKLGSGHTDGESAAQATFHLISPTLNVLCTLTLTYLPSFRSSHLTSGFDRLRQSSTTHAGVLMNVTYLWCAVQRA